MNISICICTRQRQDGLKRLLNSLDEIIIPENTKVRIIIVENDSENFSEMTVREYSRGSKLNISYFLESRQGIVFARNRSIAEAGNCDFCCFTDDDQIVSPEWLTELLRCQEEFNSDGVAGPTNPLFNKEVPIYIRSFHKPKTYQYGTIVESAFTGCLLIRKKFLDLLEGPFDRRLNFSGGEDSFLTKQISDLGGIIRYNPKAIAYEIIPEERSTIRFVIRRTFRTSNTRLIINAIEAGRFAKFYALPKLVIRFCYGIIITIPFLIFGKAGKLKGLIKIVNAVGGFSFIFGKKSQFYK